MPARSPAAGLPSSSSRCWRTTSPAWRRSRRAADCAIGADESIHGLEDIRRHHERKAARGVSLKTIKLGGMRGVMAAGALCEQLGMAVNVSCKTGESSIACAAGVHIAAALPQIDWGLTLSNEGLADDATARRSGSSTAMWRCPIVPGSGSMWTRIASAAIGATSRPGKWHEADGMKQTNIGIAVVGAGRIGTLRARLAAKHPAVRYLAISDRDPARARALADAGRRRSPQRQQRGGDRPIPTSPR